MKQTIHIYDISAWALYVVHTFFSAPSCIGTISGHPGPTNSPLSSYNSYSHSHNSLTSSLKQYEKQQTTNICTLPKPSCKEGLLSQEQKTEQEKKTANKEEENMPRSSLLSLEASHEQRHSGIGSDLTPEAQQWLARSRILRWKAELLRKLDNSDFIQEAKQQIRRYIEEYDGSTEEIHSLAGSGSDDDQLLTFLYAQYLAQSDINNRRDQSIPPIQGFRDRSRREEITSSLSFVSLNQLRFLYEQYLAQADITDINNRGGHESIPTDSQPTKEHLINTLEKDKRFSAEEKNSIQYRLENLTIGNGSTYNDPICNALAISNIVAACGSVHPQDILKWINEDIKKAKQKEEDKKIDIQPKIKKIMLQEKKGEGVCSICLSEEEKLPTLPCGHCFHLDCITTLVATNGNDASCPNCREKIEM